MKNILIRIPSYSKGNIGDAALISTIKNIFVNHNLIIPSNEKEINSINLDNIDFLIYFGNDCIAYYGISSNIIKKCLHNKKKVHIINTSWGSYPKKENIMFLNSIANNPNFQIYMRDKFSHDLIQKDIKFYNTPILTADLAFLCEKNENNKIQNLEDWINKNDKPIIGINTHNDFKEYNNTVKDELRKFIVNNKDKYRYLFIPHDSRKREYEDLMSLHKSCKDIDGYTTNYLDPNYEKYITSKLFLVITGRMHLSILTIPNGIPVIGIAYNGVKAKGTFEHFGLENLVIEPKNIDIINNKVKYIENNYKIIQNIINKNNNKVKNLIKNSLNNIMNKNLLIKNTDPCHYEIIETLIVNYYKILKIKNDDSINIYISLYYYNESFHNYINKKYPKIIFINPKKILYKNKLFLKDVINYDYCISCTIYDKDFDYLDKNENSTNKYISHEITNRLKKNPNVYFLTPLSKSNYIYADILPYNESKIISKIPIYIIQGNLNQNRRNLNLLIKILNNNYKYKFIIKLIGKGYLPRELEKYKDKIVLKKNLIFTDYHKEFLDSYCILPLISKKTHPQYYSKKLTSTINYARGYKLKCLIDKDLQEIYNLKNIEIYNDINDISIGFKNTLEQFYNNNHNFK